MLFRSGGSSRDGISDHSTSRILAVRATKDYIATTSQPALWRGGLSNFKVSKQVTLNIGGNPHLMAYAMSFKMAQNYNMWALECPTLYMPIGFQTVYEINVATKSFQRISLPGRETKYTDKPIMYANGNNIAIGVKSIKTSGLTNGSLLYAYFGILSQANEIDWTTKWSAWYHNNVRVVGGTEISTIVYIAVGTPQEVCNALTS